jgi:hypothetical protein
MTIVKPQGVFVLATPRRIAAMPERARTVPFKCDGARHFQIVRPNVEAIARVKGLTSYEDAFHAYPKLC